MIRKEYKTKKIISKLTELAEMGKTKINLLEISKVIEFEPCELDELAKTYRRKYYYIGGVKFYTKDLQNKQI